MCFNISLTHPGQDVTDRFDANFDDGISPIYHSSAFHLPLHPVICIDDPHRIRFARWGLVPRWIRDEKGADGIRFNTLNARSETIFEKPSFRYAIMRNRCLIPVDGFFEFREVNGKKFPYHIRMKDGRLFSFAGIYEDWKTPEGRLERTFSIVTAEANSLMAVIHNTKKRMPVILTKQEEGPWLDPDSSRKDLEIMMKPYVGNDLEAFPVSRLLTDRDSDTNIPEVLERTEYEELNFLDLDSFA